MEKTVTIPEHTYLELLATQRNHLNMIGENTRQFATYGENPFDAEIKEIDAIIQDLLTSNH